MKIRKIFIVGATLIALIATTKTGKIQSTEHIYDLSSLYDFDSTVTLSLTMKAE